MAWGYLQGAVDLIGRFHIFLDLIGFQGRESARGYDEADVDKDRGMLLPCVLGTPILL